MQNNTEIGVVGLWHLGCVLSAAWSKLGFRVTGFDYKKDLISDLRRNKPPIFEPGLEEEIKISSKAENLLFTDRIENLKDCSFVFLAYDTPVLDNDECDLGLLEKAIRDLCDVLANHSIVIASSQTPVGTCSKFRDLLQRKNPTLELVYSPENLRLGSAIDCYLKPGRIILGSDSKSASVKSASLFSNIPAEIITMSIASAEMVKHGINAFLANSIVFTNHLADLCEAAGANIVEVVRGLKSDERIGQKAYLSAGIGFSGGTLGRDLKVLAALNKTCSRSALLFESLYEFNADRKKIIIDKVTELLDGRPAGRTVAVLGLTYKPGTSTLRRSLPLQIVELLINKGAEVKAYDPKANYQELEKQPPFRICRTIDEAISGSDLALILTEWKEFRDYDWGRAVQLMKKRRVFDAKNLLIELGLSEKGYKYVGIGFSDNQEK